MDLGNRSISAFLWGAGGTALRIAIQVVSQIVLARLLGPEQFGLFAVGLVVVFFTTMIADGGLAYGLVQKAELTEEDVRFAFTWQMLAAFVVSGALLLSAGGIAGYFEDERIANVVRLLSPIALVTSAGAVPAALLRRRLDFKWINIASVVSYAVAFLLIGIPMALMGWGVQALIAAFLIQSLLASVIVLLAARQPLRPLLCYPGGPHILRFGGMVLVTNLINWVLSSLDRAVVSAYLGVVAAGLYATVSNLINTPAQSALATLQPVFYAASSQVQGQMDQLRRGLRAMISAVAVFIAPVFAAVAAVAHTFIDALYGSTWLAGAPVLTPLALAVPPMLLMGLSTPVLWTAGQPKKEFQLQVPIAIVWVLASIGVAQIGSIALMGWAVLGILVVRAAAIVAVTMSAVSMPKASLITLLGPGALLSATTALVASVADRAFASLPNSQLRLLAVICACAAAMILGLRVLRTHQPTELRDLLAKCVARVPTARLRDMCGQVLGA